MPLGNFVRSGVNGIAGPTAFGSNSPKADSRVCTSCAKTGREQLQYARRTRLFDHLVGAGEEHRGTVRLRVLAALRFMISSTFVAC